ncbi:uncharacterized protein LOC134184194 isoform X2 [Corticium candelabrum]|uniref:uncharacterized protein LOC134184194 isoform X2 n=1 Tax=Corticium candelabrum TaxID=121492 RepID=UPI002E307DF1|nr:uncharacterized protein LOC134184194 isoform X2 [Corticium candelabrum]
MDHHAKGKRGRDQLLSYNGRKDLEPVKPSNPFPSQYTSHFSLGDDGVQVESVTQTQRHFPRRSLEQTAEVYRRAQELGTQQMSGADMIKATQQSTMMSFISQYEDVHNKLGHARGCGVPRQAKPELPRNPINGELLKHNAPTQFNLSSGNRLLKTSRNSCGKQLLV